MTPSLYTWYDLSMVKTSAVRSILPKVALTFCWAVWAVQAIFSLGLIFMAFRVAGIDMVLVFLFLFGFFSIVVSAFIPPFCFVGPAMIGLYIFLARKKSLATFAYTWVLGTLLALITFGFMIVSCDEFCRAGEPVSGFAIIFYAGLSQIWWMPVFVWGIHAIHRTLRRRKKLPKKTPWLSSE